MASDRSGPHGRRRRIFQRPAKELLFEDRFVCVIWRENPLSEGELTLERYLSARHVTMQPPGGTLPLFDSWLSEALGASREIGLSTYSFSVIPKLVVGNDLVGTVHSRLARQAQSALPIVIRPVPVHAENFNQTMQWHKYLSRDPGLIWLRQLIKHAADLMGS